MKEMIYDVFWEGPFEWEKRHPYLKKYHVMYSIEGSHPVYGGDTLLCIRRTDVGMGNRLSYHEEWIDDEPDPVSVRGASIGEFTDWEAWEKLSHYPKANLEIASKVEALLIFAHQPAYNTMGKSSLPQGKGIRIFNTGKCGLLLPELSCLYYGG